MGATVLPELPNIIVILRRQPKNLVVTHATVPENNGTLPPTAAGARVPGGGAFNLPLKL